MRTLTELNTLILGWAAERQILKNSTPFAQAKKTAEEVMELIQADMWHHIASENLSSLKHANEHVTSALFGIQDAIGDIYVTLVVGLGCECHDVPLPSVKEMQSVSEYVFPSNAPALRDMVCQLLPDFFVAAHKCKGYAESYETAVIVMMDMLSHIAKTYGLTLEECVDSAYEQIKDRKGYLREDGVFVKEAT